MDDLKAIIESLLFISDTPLTVDKIKTVLELEDRKRIQDVIAELSGEYDSQQRGFFIAEIAGGYQMRTRPQYAVWVRKLKQSKPPRLSRAALEALAIIAYKQPCMRTDVEHLRGVDCGGVLHMLLERGVIRTLGRKDLPGRPLVYGTSKQFLEMFDLKDLKNLPTLKDMQELGEIWPSESKDQIQEETEQATASDGSVENLEEALVRPPNQQDLEGDWPEESVGSSEVTEEQWPEEYVGDGQDDADDWPEEADEEDLERDWPEESDSDKALLEEQPEELPEELSGELSGEFDDDIEEKEEQEEPWPNDSN